MHKHRPHKVVLAQLSHALNDRNHWFCNKQNVPLAAGYVRSLARSRELDAALSIEILSPQYADHAGDAALVATLVEQRVDVLGLSLYPWNLSRSLRLAEALRAARPGVRVFAGGPEVNAATLAALLGPKGEGPIDVAVPGEGEVSFCDALEALAGGRDLDEVAGLVLADGDGPRATADRPTLVELDRIPSPFLGGDIDARGYRQVHVLFERGCIYSCNYCHWWPDRRSKGSFSLERIEAELAHLRECGVEEVILLDASLNTSRRFDELCAVLARSNGDGGLAIKVHVLFDHLEREQLEALVAGGVSKLEVGLQSTDPDTLRRVRRPTDLGRLRRALELTEGLPLDLQIDFIMGLPGDTEETIRGTARRIRELCAGRRVAQISPFVLSVGSPTQLRAEAATHRIRHQPEPPYRVLAVGDLDYPSLRRLRMELPRELGYPEHPCFAVDRPHYYVNLFEPELASHSSSDPGGDAIAAGPPGSVAPPALVDAIEITCHRTEPGHEHPFVGEALPERLAQLVQLRLRAAAPDACAGHVAALLGRLSRPNPYLVWDLVIESDATFDLDLLDGLGGAIEHRVHNLDWDCYLVGEEEGAGHARMATRPFAIVSPAIDPGWLAAAAARFAVITTLRVHPGSDAKALVGAAAARPGEGVLVELDPECGPNDVLAVIAHLPSLDRRVRCFRNQALKTLFESQVARRQGRKPPRTPYADRRVIVVAADGEIGHRSLTARQATLDMTTLCMDLRVGAAASA